LVIPGFGSPKVDLKKMILKKNIEQINTTFTGCIDIKVFNYDETPCGIDCNETFVKGYPGQFLYRYITPSLVSKYDYVIILLDDIELQSNFNLDRILYNYRYYGCELMSPALTSNSEYSHRWMLQEINNADKIRQVTAIELFCYIMSSSAYEKYYTLLNEQSAWLWGIDYHVNNMLSCYIINCVTMHHHIKGASYSPDKPCAYSEMNDNNERFKNIGLKKYNPAQNIQYLTYNQIPVSGEEVPPK
ncbi:MAG: hypothetical protein EB127_20680, partial [Alphaproteobacteria bacterium]|nr:hypothetical protein [Alphaproteobacteria bacterium]